MKWGYIIIIIAVILTAVAIIVWQRRKTRYIFRNIHDMLDKAIDGSFTEQTFDESMLASVESKLNDYLLASAVSAHNLTSERDKIKELIADISHQTKTPITNILLYSQLLSEQDLPEECQSHVHLLQSQAERLSFLISSLIKLSRLETGILTLNPLESSVQPILEEVQEQFTSKAKEKGIKLSFISTDSKAVFDPKWTSEALANIVDNAIKYTPTGGKVSVNVTPYDLFLRIDITDNGVGIAEDELSRIFSRFYRSPSQSTIEGVGIGLYLTRQILSEQGGYIKVSSSVGKGSVFSMFLPNSL